MSSVPEALAGLRRAGIGCASTDAGGMISGAKPTFVRDNRDTLAEFRGNLGISRPSRKHDFRSHADLVLTRAHRVAAPGR